VHFLLSQYAEFCSDNSDPAVVCCVAGDLFQKFNFLRSLFAHEFAFYAAWAEKVSSRFSVFKINFVTSGEGRSNKQTNKQTTNSVALSPQANYTD
jgi:hypothetical protein